jgi:hypothetical protein
MQPNVLFEPCLKPEQPFPVPHFVDGDGTSQTTGWELNMASFAALLSGYKNKTAPPPPTKPVVIKHPLYDRLVDIR